MMQRHVKSIKNGDLLKPLKTKGFSPSQIVVLLFGSFLPYIYSGICELLI